MNSEDIIENTDTSISSREHSAQYFINSSENIGILVEHVFKENAKLALNALMILEIISRKNVALLQDFIWEIIKSGNKHKNSSCRRCLGKIFNAALENHVIKPNSIQLKPEEKNKILELSFQWLIEEEQTAVKVFSMQNVFILRHEADWVSEELKAVLERDIINSSAGYRSRATKILRKLKK